MVDPERRKKLAFHLRQLAVGQITNDDFETFVGDDLTAGWLPEHYYRSVKAQTDDPAIQPMLELSWNLYSDLDCYKLRGKDKLSEETMTHIARCILYLQTKNEYEFPDIKFVSPLMRYTLKDFLVLIFTLGKNYRDETKEQEQIYKSIFEGGDRKYWPFSSREKFEEALKQPPFLRG